MKKFYLSFLIIFFIIFTSCKDEDESGTDTGKITFYNISSYKVVVHQDYFSGPVLLEMPAGGSPRQVDVRVSDNHSGGSTFSIEYLYRLNEAEYGFNYDSSEIIASGIDPDVQINVVVDAGKSYNVQIPQPKELEFKSAFIQITNISDLPVELKYYGTIYKQTGNNAVPVAPGKTGVYKLSGIPDSGMLYQNLTVATSFEGAVIPEFTAQNGWIYYFTYNGVNAVNSGKQSLVFK